MVKYNPNENEMLKMNKLHKKIFNKKYCPGYDWMQESANKAVKNMWICATKINKIAPQDDVYRFYNYSEVFQCLDATFFLFSIILVALIIINAFDLPFALGFHFNIVFLITMLIVCILLHLLSKACAKVHARRFLYQIEKSLKSRKFYKQKQKRRMLCKKRRYKQKRFWVFKTWRIATKKSYK